MRAMPMLVPGQGLKDAQEMAELAAFSCIRVPEALRSLHRDHW